MYEVLMFQFHKGTIRTVHHHEAVDLYFVSIP